MLRIAAYDRANFLGEMGVFTTAGGQPWQSSSNSGQGSGSKRGRDDWAHSLYGDKEEEAGAVSALVPKVLHFFWAGGPMRTTEIGNLLSFAAHADAGWQINIWTDDKDHIVKPLEKAGVRLHVGRVHVRIVSEGLQDASREMLEAIDAPNFIGRELQIEYKQSVRLVRDMVERLLVGLKQPAAAKDLFVPYMLFLEGGFYFDLDIIATAPLKTKPATSGFLVQDNCTRVDAFASMPHAQFWLDAINCASKLYRLHIGRRYPRNHFLELDSLKDKTQNGWERQIIAITGGFQRMAYRNELDCHYLRESRRRFILETNFFKQSGNRLSVGVMVRADADDTSGWRRRERPKESIDDINIHYHF